jgi:hypothetical protein
MGLYGIEQAIAATISRINPNDFSTYSDPISRIKVKYPSDWIGSQGALSHSIDRTKFNLLINDVDFKPIDESVGLTVTSFNISDTTLVHFVDANLISMKNNPSLNITSINKTAINGIPAYKVGVTGQFDFEGGIKKFGKPDQFGFLEGLGGFKKLNSSLIKHTYFFLVKDGIGYIILYYSDPFASDSLNKYSFYLPTAQKIINSFEIIPR